MSRELELADFSGTARLFPLPGFVFFPFVTKLFHIFEPRYRQLAADALAGDKFLAIVQLSEGWQLDYEGAPPIEKTACLAKIEQHTPLGDGRCNLLLRGVCRARVERELLTNTAYRQAQVRPLADLHNLEPPDLRRSLHEQTMKQLPPQSSAFKVMETLFASKMPLGGLADVVGYYLPLSPPLKQKLLDETDVERRVKLLLERLAQPRPLDPPPEPTDERPSRPWRRIGFSDN